ncbi:hypothetical protein AA0313_0411 [Acetobacter indonesiensis NRIC 0313]|nr:hypothetical protein AA0313_0411 [Acetobacter indonesiensis NRIC 0313]
MPEQPAQFPAPAETGGSVSQERSAEARKERAGRDGLALWASLLFRLKKPYFPPFFVSQAAVLFYNMGMHLPLGSIITAFCLLPLLNILAFR